MARAGNATPPDALGDASVTNRRTLVRLLEMLRAAPETHLALAEVARMAAEARITTSPAALQRHLDTLTELGLLGRLPMAVDEPVYDTVPEPHSHLIYQETGQVIDLHVSSETLLAILREALAAQPGGVDVLVRVRPGAGPGPG